jgi:hypothetical protein
MSPCLHVATSPHFWNSANGNENNGKRQLPFELCKLKTVNLRLFAANRNEKQMFVFLGRQTINGGKQRFKRFYVYMYRAVAHIKYREGGGKKKKMKQVV